MKKVAFFIILLILGCKPPDRTTPQSAFARLAKCIDNADEKCLFTELERDSRWSCHTIYKTLVEMRQIVETSYPANMVRGAYGSWFEEAQSANPAELFAIYCGKRRCLEEISQGFGAIVKITPAGGNAVLVETTRGHTFKMASAEKKWGLALFTEDLHKSKIRLLDRLAGVKKNAAEFQEQRLAGSGPAGEGDQP